MIGEDALAVEVRVVWLGRGWGLHAQSHEMLVLGWKEKAQISIFVSVRLSVRV